MWLLQYLSESFIHLLVLISAGGLLLMPLLLAIPFFQTYKTAATYILIAALTFGVWTEGVISQNKVWEAKMAQQKIKDTKKEVKMAGVTAEVVEKVEEKKAVIKEKQNVLIVKVPVYITKEVDAKCPIPNSFVQLHDDSAGGQDAASTAGIQGGDSDVGLSEVLSTDIKNHSKYYQLKNKYEGLLSWCEKQIDIVNEK